VNQDDREAEIKKLAVSESSQRGISGDGKWDASTYQGIFETMECGNCQGLSEIYDRKGTRVLDYSGVHCHGVALGFEKQRLHQCTTFRA
jgi:hypothetical protein